METATAVYSVKFFFRGRRIAVDNEPPADIVDAFLNFFTGGMVMNDWNADKNEAHKHYCDSRCAIETCIVLGAPYTESVMDACKV